MKTDEQKMEEIFAILIIAQKNIEDIGPLNDDYYNEELNELKEDLERVCNKARRIM